MPRLVKCGLIQATHACDTGEKLEIIREANVHKHLELIEQAGQQGVQILCMQEIFTGPYFCAEQSTRWYDATETIPDGPTTQLMQELAKKHAMVIVVPLYEIDGTGVWEKFYFKPGNLGYPVFKTKYATIGVYICYDRHFPEGARALGLNGAEIVFIPSATSRGLSEYLWRIEQVSHAVANGYFVGTINRVGIEKDLGDDDFYGQSYFVDPRGQFIGDLGSAHDEELIVRDMDLDKIQEVRQTWQFYRDRRPDAYGDLVEP